MVAEFWPGWFDHWGEQHHKMEVNTVIERVSNILRAGASINFYMFHGRLDTNRPDCLFHIFHFDFRSACCSIQAPRTDKTV